MSEPDGNTGPTVAELAERIARELADRNPAAWKKQDPEAAAANNDLRRTIAAAMNQHGGVCRIPGVLPHIFALIERGTITALSTFNGLPCLNVSDVKTNPEDWRLSPHDEEIVESRLLGTTGQAQLDERTAARAGDRIVDEGRHTQVEAAAVADQKSAGTQKRLRGVHPWIVEAQRLAAELLKRDHSKDLHPSLQNVADSVYESMRKSKIYGPHGKPLSAATIKRDALQGKWWKANGKASS
jgi:hypothetical protein